ncbi:hypothetical protein G7046_g8485 [Stylonectria norvegica]|nr:hypothetical protein G7046_g8485 [Stylonectria norvegica]
MSDVDATKPVEAAQPEAAPATTQVTEEKPVEQTEEKTQEQAEEADVKMEDKPEANVEASTEDKAEDKAEDKTEAVTDSAAKPEPKILKTTAQIDFENHRNNRKFDPSVREVTDDPVSIRKQVEFYFGDYNFPQDKFMWESCGGSENKPMKIKAIHSFKRMRTFQPYTAVVAALRESKILDVEGEEGEEEVKRKDPYKPMAAGKAKVEAATIYAKGFGDENPDTQFDLESFFAQYGEIKGLKLRRTNENLFKGSAFVTFADEDEAKKFLALDPTPQWKGHDLKVMTKRAYCDEKSDLIRQGKLEPNASNPKKFYEGKDPNNRNSRGRGRGNRDGGDSREGRDPDDWKKRRNDDQKSGFNDRRGGGRGGRGRGRGGRGGRGRGDRGGRDRDGGRGGGRDDRNKNDSENKHNSNDTMPRIQSTAEVKTEGSKDTETNNNGKRAREDDGASVAPAPKKVDAKTEST